MPDAYLTLWTNVNLYGAVSAKTVYFYSTPSIHYDTSLRTAAWRIFQENYYITTWREITDPSDSQRITMP